MTGEQDPKRPQLERLYERGILTRRQFIAALAVAGAGASSLEYLFGSEPLPARAQAVTARYLVLLVLDAFRPDYTGLAPMPALEALMSAGTTYEQAWVGQLESETPTGHATISTGALPRRDGVLGFEWRDPRSRREVLDAWPRGVLAGALERDLRAAGVNSIPHAVKAADPHAMVVTLSSEKVYAADAMGAAVADYILYHRRTAHTMVPAAVPGHSPPPDFFAHPHLRARNPMSRFTNWDYLSGALALTAVEAFRPRVLMVNLPGADAYGHPYGGPATPAVMQQVVTGIDRDIARIVGAYRRAGIAGETLFVVTADHGMIPNVRAVDGNTVKAAVRRAGGHYLFHTGGTAADIYLVDSRRAASVAAEMARVPNVAAAYYQVLHGGLGTYLPAAGTRIVPALDNAFRALLATFAGPRAPDVVAVFRENTIGSRWPHAHGDHGGLSWGAQAIPLVLAGPGVRPGHVSPFPARLVDIAPTVLRLLGLRPDGMDGLVLADALLGPAAGDLADQATISPTLTGYRAALIDQAIQNVGEDLRLGLHPPPSRPARP